MIAKQGNASEGDIWARIAAPLVPETISWRQDGRAIAREGKYFARFVAYIDAQTVRERLDLVVPGEWDLTLELLPSPANFADSDGDAQCAFKARLQILGVIREDVGQGKDYKQAASDAFKRAAVRFGVAHELYAYEQNWVQVDGDGKYAKALEDPQAAYERRQVRGATASAPNEQPTPQRASSPASTNGAPSATAKAASGNATPNAKTATDGADDPSCPKCGGKMWDNRISKRNPKAPDFKCRSRSCDGVKWPAKANGNGASDDDEFRDDSDDRGF